MTKPCTPPASTGRAATSTPPRRCIIFNPTAKGSKAVQFLSFLDSLRSRCDLQPTLHPGHARELAREAVENGYETIIAAGGDGTMNEVVNGIADVPFGLEKTSLGLLPFGTVNVLARELKIPIAHYDAWRVIKKGATRRIDLPSIEFTDPDGSRAKRHFVQLAGVGPDARAIELVDLKLKRMVGPLAYFVAGIQALREPAPDITVSTANRTVTGKLVLIGNGRFYGGPFNFFPQSQHDDGLIDICVLPDASLRTMLKLGSGILTENVAGLTRAIYFQADDVKITSANPASVQIEGDAIGTTPLSINSGPHSLSIITP